MAEGDLLSRYQIDQVFRGEGDVRSYLATAPDGRNVCIKVVEAADAEARAAVERLGALASLEHPNVARVLDRGLVESGYAVVREWVVGTHLGATPLPSGITTSTVAGYVAEAAVGLAAVHDRGLVHGGIRPSNLVVDARGQVKLVDAAIPPTAGRAAVPGAPASSVYYTSPEELDGSQPTSASDIYSLGAVLYELEVGRPPFDEGGVVDLVIAAVPLVEVPNVVGLDQASAEKALKDAGLAVGKVTQKQTADAKAGVVLEQAPASGKQANKGSTVDLVVAAAALVKVPNVVGRTEAEARAALEAAGLKVGAVTEKESTNVAPGVVRGQSPDAGAQGEGGSAVALEVGKAPQVKVPKVTGLPESGAAISLARAGLSVGDIQYVFDPAVAAGMVKSQNPAEGTSLPAGSQVGLVVSKGTQSGAVPDVVGLTEADATGALEAGGFSVEVSRVVSTNVEPGLVVAQTPAAAAQAPSGSAVTIEVSKGSSPTAKSVVPDLVGLDLAKALKALSDAKLKPLFQFVTSDKLLLVIEQDPVAGKVDPGTAVLLSVGVPGP